MAAAPAAASCMSTENGCVVFDCLVHLWEWLDPPIPQSQFEMENKKQLPATQQPLTQHVMAHHVHPDQIYSQQHPQMTTHLTSAQAGQLQPNGVMHQLLQSQYHSNMNARSPLLENRHDLYGTGHNHEYARHYGANDNYNYPQSPPRPERTEIHTDHNVNHELLQNIPVGYNAEVYQDYLKRNPPKDTNQIYQNHQATYRPNVNQYGSKPYLPYSSRIGPQSNTELLRRQYSEIQQMKLQQQMHYQNQAQMHQQQKFAERQLLQQQIYGVQPPPNLQNSIYSDSSYRDLDRYSSKEFSPETPKEDMYAKNNEYRDMENQNRLYQEQQWQANQAAELREQEHYRRSEGSHEKSQSPPSDPIPHNFNNHNQKNNMVSPMKSSESSTPSVKSPSSDSRRSSSGTQALRSPVAQRIPSAPVAMSGILYKQGSDGLKVWRKRWFVLSEYCLFYYKSQDEEKLLGSVLLPSYKVSACTSEDRVLRKFSFKLEHANMRTYILAAPDQDAMLKWVKAMTMAALMQSPNEQSQTQNERTAVKTEDGEEIPTYANAPPKPRRSNEGYNSPSPDMYDPNYDLLKKPASHYSQGNTHRYPDQGNYPASPNMENSRSPQSPQTQYKRPYDTQHLSLPLNNENQPTVSYTNNAQSPYFDRTRNQQVQETKQEQLYERQSQYKQELYERQQQNKQELNERQPQRNPFLPDSPPENPQIEPENENQDRTNVQNLNIHKDYTESKNINDINTYSRESEPRNASDIHGYNREVYGELNSRPSRTGSTVNERLNERRTPDAYGRSTTMAPYQTKGKIGDYEDIYGSYATEKEYSQTYAKSPNPPQARDAISISSQGHQQQQENPVNYPQEKTFTGPAVLRRKKMQASGIQPQMPRPHSADFLEYEAKNDNLNKTVPAQSVFEPPRQPQRPKSSLDINSYYDPSSDRYYSEESYAEKMRQSAQYLQQKGNLGPRTMDIPLAKYASGLAQKQLSSAYSQITNNNYETEFNARNKDNVSYSSKYGDLEGLNSNWTLKEKGIESQKDYINRSGSVMSDGSNVSGFVKDMSKFDPNSDGFLRSASARLPSTNNGEGEKKVQQREESMKRLLEWKQRMLQSPLTRKSTPATISLARSLNQSRQSLRSDQYKPKTYANATYNSYSSDDEEETTGTDLQIPRDMQAGRSHKVSLSSPNIMRPITPHAPCVNQVIDTKDIDVNTSDINVESTNKENTYENILCTISIPKVNLDNDDDDYAESQTSEVEKSTQEEVKQSASEEGYETHESEAESEGADVEYTDNDLDEVLLESEVDIKTANELENSSSVIKQELEENMPENNVDDDVSLETQINNGQSEDHYLPMSPRKVSVIEQAHKNIIKNLRVFDNKIQQVTYEDNPYVEMNIGSEEDTQTYEVVCVNNGRVEPVYMELSDVSDKENTSKELSNSKSSDTASNFADTKDHTLKRNSKNENKVIYKSECSDVDDDSSKETALDSPFSRFSISDTFRPASYYLNASQNHLDVQDDLDLDILPPPPIPSSSPPCEDLSDDALSKYILDKLDKSDMSCDNSILKMLTTENQKMNTIKRKTTSLMIYGSRTSIHDTLSRGEKIRNSRASLNERNRILESSPNLLSNNVLDPYNSSSVESDSLRSFNADRGSSRLSLDSDISSKFDMIPSNISSEVTSLNESDMSIDFRHSSGGYKDLEMMMKRRPLSDDSIFELAESTFPPPNEAATNVDLDRYLDNLQPSTSNNVNSCRFNVSTADISIYKDNLCQAAVQSVSHTRCSSSPVVHNSKVNAFGSRNYIGIPFKNISEQTSGYTGSRSSCSSVGIPKSPISYYCKNDNGETALHKNLNNESLSDKIKEYENETKLALKTGNDTHASSSSTGFHSRESSAEHSAPYYYSDLSSQEQINILPTSHYLKNTNLYRKLNNQRRRGPLHKKNEISHIHNPIRNNQVMMSEQTFELAAARSVSVEFLSATDKDPEIDLKNIYESSGGRNSKIPESMNLSGLGCKKSSSNNSNLENSSMDSSGLSASALIKLSSTSMSSHCSGNSSNTVYYDAEAEASAYENVICHGEKIWEDDKLWRDNLRRVSHRHARSMDDLDSMPVDSSTPRRVSFEACGMNSIKRVKKEAPKKISRNVTYVNCDFQGRALMYTNRDNNNASGQTSQAGHRYFEEEPKIDDNDVYVSLAESTGTSLEPADEGVYEQLSLESPGSSMKIVETNSVRRRRKFEIDREKLRQWDLMSSGLMKTGPGRVRGKGAGVGLGVAVCSADTGADSTSNEASMTLAANNTESGTNNNANHQQTLSKKAFLGSNTSIGRNSSNREGSIPVRAVSPRVRWVEDKPPNDHYGSQNMSASQQNLNATEDSWATTRSPSRASQQPIRAVSPRVRRNTENDEMQRAQQNPELTEIPTAGELLGRTHEELVLLLIQLRRRHTATSRAIEQCCSQIESIEECRSSSIKAMEREEHLQRLEQLKMQLMELEQQYEKSKPLVQLVDNMVKLGSLYNRPGSTVERLERNQRLRQKVLAEHALEQQRWLESVAAGKPLETEAARARVAELWALEQELADEASILQGIKTDKDTIESLLTGVRGKLATVHKTDLLSEQRRQPSSAGLEAELTRVHAMLAHNSKKLEQTVADNARLERELQQLRRALQARRAAAPAHPTAMLEDEVSRVQQLVSALQRQRQELSRAVRHLTQQSHALQSTHDSMPGGQQRGSSQQRPLSSWSETNLDTGHTIDHGYSDYEYETNRPTPTNYNQATPTHYNQANPTHYNQASHYNQAAPTHYNQATPTHYNQAAPTHYNQAAPTHYNQAGMDVPLYVDTRAPGDVTSPLTSEDAQHGGFANLSNVEKQEIKTVRIVKRESERRQRDRDRSLWPSNTITTNLDQFIEDELVQSFNNTRASSLPRTDYKTPPNPNYLQSQNMELSPKYVSSPSLSYDYSQNMSSLNSSYSKSYNPSGYDRMSLSAQYTISPTDSTRTLTNDPMTMSMSKTSSIVSLTRSNMELSPIFKSEAAKQIITEMSGEPKNGSLHRRQVPKEKRRHYTAPHHLSAKTLNELPKDAYNQDKLGRSLDDADMERALRSAPAPDVVRSALPPQMHKLADNTIDQLLAAPQKILIPERYIPEKPPELSPEEQQKRQEKVESIKKMLTGTPADQGKSPDAVEKRQREHLLQMNQILAKQVTEMSKIIAGTNTEGPSSNH